jgi:hypothetical protein
MERVQLIEISWILDLRGRIGDPGEQHLDNMHNIAPNLYIVPHCAECMAFPKLTTANSSGHYFYAPNRYGNKHEVDELSVIVDDNR